MEPLNLLRLGNKFSTETSTTEVPSVIVVTNQYESQGFRIRVNEHNELVVTKFNHDDSSETISVRPNTSNQITIS